jgi:phospholipase/lecithinase/hemolysin
MNSRIQAAIVAGFLCISPALAGTLTQIVAFGDSLVDDGNLFAATAAEPGGPFPESPPYFDGRLSNGAVWVEVLSRRLGVKLTNYAYGGAQTDRDNVYDADFPGLELPGLLDQVDMYVTGLAGETADPNALFVVAAGASDFESPPLNPAAAIEASVGNIVEAVVSLSAAGAERFLVSNLPDLGLTPRAIGSGLSGLASALTDQFNAALEPALLGLGLDLVIVDASGVLRVLVASPAQFGLTNVDTSCLEVACNTAQNLDPDEFLFWDGVHPTAAAHRIVSGFTLPLVDPFAAARRIDRVVETSGSPVAITLFREQGPGEAVELESRDWNGTNLGVVTFFGGNFTGIQLAGVSPSGGVNANVAVAAVRHGDQTLAVERRDVVTGELIGKRTFFLGDGFTPIWLLGIGDISGDQVGELAYLAVRDSDNRALVEIRNGATGALERRIFFSSGFAPVTARGLEDLDGDGNPEIAVLLLRDDGRYKVEIRNASGAAATRSTFFNAGFTPVDFEVGPDPDGDGVPELAVLAVRGTDGRAKVEMRNAFGPPDTRSRFYSGGFTPIDLVPVTDSDDSGVPEWGVLQLRDLDNRPALEVRNAFGPKNTKRSFFFDANWRPLKAFDSGDADGNGVSEISVTAMRLVDERAAFELRNVRDPSNRRRIFFGQ